MHLLYILLYVFPFELIRRIGLTIKASWVVDHFLYSPDLNEWIGSIALRRNKMLVTPIIENNILYGCSRYSYFDNDFCVWFLKKRKILEGEIPK